MLAQWQHSLILQQHYPFTSYLPCQFLVFFRVNQLLCQFGRHIRILEQAHLKLQTKYITDRPVQIGHGNQAFFVCLLQIFSKSISTQIHIQTGFQCFHCRLLVALGGTHTHNTFYTDQIRIDKPFESPLIAQHISQQFLVGSARHSVYRIVRSHKGTCSLLHRFPERRQVFRKQLAHTTIGTRSVMSGFGYTVCRKMLQCGIQMLPVILHFTLHSLHHSHSHDGSQHWVFPKGFLHA